MVRSLEEGMCLVGLHTVLHMDTVVGVHRVDMAAEVQQVQRKYLVGRRVLEELQDSSCHTRDSVGTVDVLRMMEDIAVEDIVVVDMQEDEYSVGVEHSLEAVV